LSVSQLQLVASFAASGTFYVLAVVSVITRRSPVPPTLPATSDLGEQSPAVANLLANGGRLTPDAVPATLLDLAARRVLTIEETTPGSYGCRLGDRPADGLTPYEVRVLNLLRQKAQGGLVPASALTTGPADQAKSWLSAFRREVVSDAMHANLCKRRWPAGLLAALAALGLIALLLGVYAGDSHDVSWPQLFAVGAAISTFVVMSRVFGDDSELVTSTGLPVQARWLSLRRYLHQDEVFASLPPTAVAVRDRYLAYGAALGAAAAAVRAMPMGAESDRRAWTNYGGPWRQVTVSYPKHWPPAWGDSPRQDAGGALRWGAFGLFLLWLSSQLTSHLSFGPNTDALTRDLSIAIVLVEIASVGMVAIGLGLLIGAFLALFRTEVKGEAIRVRTPNEGGGCYLAVYTGVGNHVRAWVVRAELCSSLVEYQVVTVSVSPLFGYVHAVRPAVAPAPSAV
jgi:hypothetical protein